jgi:uncharacterized protein (DUF983 family)
MAKHSIGTIINKLLLGLALRCPNCGKGRTFTSLFKMEETCPFCHVRYERLSGESLGGMFINLGLAELLSVAGYIITDFLFHPPFQAQIAFWVIFNLLFVILFYRHARSMWVAIVYLTGGVYPDSEQPR